jgi:uncharacterized protein (TIGR02246 family)
MIGYRRAWLLAIAFAQLLLASGVTGAAADTAALEDQVKAAERAFAKTMADRDHTAFATFLADDAVFFSGQQPVRGRNAVVAAWAKLYEGPVAPFSWDPEVVQVLDSGTLALSSGPVKAANGNVVGQFNSVWRREPDGRWLVVFDKGCDVCECATR